MRVVADANVLFSALIKNSVTRQVLKNDFLHLIAPDFLLQEFAKHRLMVLKKSGLSEEEFEKLVRALLDLCEIIPAKRFQPFLPEALAVSPDPFDAPYFALCMAQNCPLWSNDNRLKKQKTVCVFSTRELAEKLGI